MVNQRLTPPSLLQAMFIGQNTDKISHHTPTEGEGAVMSLESVYAINGGFASLIYVQMGEWQRTVKIAVSSDHLIVQHRCRTGDLRTMDTRSF